MRLLLSRPTLAQVQEQLATPVQSWTVDSMIRPDCLCGWPASGIDVLPVMKVQGDTTIVGEQ